MKKPLIFFIIAINLVIVGRIMWHVTHRKQRTTAFAELGHKQLAEFGLVDKITPDQYQDALAIFKRERKMWSRFQALAAFATVDFQSNDGVRHSLAGNLSLQRIGSQTYTATGTNLVGKFELTLSDPNGMWKAVTDGTPTNTVITCTNGALPEAIKAIDPATLLDMLTFPHFMPPVIYKDGPALRWQPWLTTNNTPNTYTYFNGSGDSRGFRTDFMVKDGHFGNWRRTRLIPGEPVEECLAIHFENPVESGGFWYPSLVRMSPAPTPWPYPAFQEGFFVPVVPPAPAKGKGQLVIILTNLSVKAEQL